MHESVADMLAAKIRAALTESELFLLQGYIDAGDVEPLLTRVLEGYRDVGRETAMQLTGGWFLSK